MNHQNFVLGNIGKHLSVLAPPELNENITVKINFSKCYNVRGTQQILHMELGSRNQILEVFRINTYSNSPGTNRNCLWMGGGLTIDNHTTRYLLIQSRTANS